jgi:hypothetical protein
LLARCGSGLLSTWFVPCEIEPVVSLREELSELKTSVKRPESLLQLAAPNPINAMTTNCGPTASRRSAPMGTRSHATLPASE